MRVIRDELSQKYASIKSVESVCDLYKSDSKRMLQAPDYDIIRTIGSGAFGYVFEAINRKTRQRVALKRIEKVGKGMSRQNQMLYILKGCPNIIQIQDLFYSENQQGKLVQNIVFEYLDNNLENVIQTANKKGTQLPQQTIKSYLYQLLVGVREMHQRNIAHRDLKPQNILINSKGEIKICDFGCSKIIDPNGKNTPYVMSQYYRAPQLIMAITKYSVAIDIWSVGCIMAELALLEPFFVGANEGDQLFAILKTMGSFTQQEESIWKERVPFDAKMLESLRGFKRINLSQRFGHLKEKKQFIDLLTRMLTFVPQKRISASEALEHPYFNAGKGLPWLSGPGNLH